MFQEVDYKINSSAYSSIISEVLIDDRENQRVEYALNQYTHLNPLKAHLPIGDYIFKGDNGIEVVFEYKTGADFLSSITGEDNHLHNQLYDMVTNYDYTFIIVETKDLEKEINKRYFQSGQEISTAQINGAISTYNTVSTVIMVQNKYQAFDLMMRMSAKIILQKPILYKYGKKTTNTAQNILSAIKGIDKKAELICETLNLKTVKDLMNLTKKDLKSVETIGDKTAETILKNLK